MIFLIFYTFFLLRLDAASISNQNNNIYKQKNLQRTYDQVSTIQLHAVLKTNITTFRTPFLELIYQRSHVLYRVIDSDQLSECIKLISTFKLFETTCDLPITCGQTYHKVITSKWWGGEIMLCYAFGTDMPTVFDKWNWQDNTETWGELYTFPSKGNIMIGMQDIYLTNITDHQISILKYSTNRYRYITPIELEYSYFIKLNDNKPIIPTSIISDHETNNTICYNYLNYHANSYQGKLYQETDGFSIVPMIFTAFSDNDFFMDILTAEGIKPIPTDPYTIIYNATHLCNVPSKIIKNKKKICDWQAYKFRPMTCRLIKEEIDFNIPGIGRVGDLIAAIFEAVLDSIIKLLTHITSKMQTWFIQLNKKYKIVEIVGLITYLMYKQTSSFKLIASIIVFVFIFGIERFEIAQ